MAPRVRAATVEDADGIARIHVDAWRAAYRGQMPDELLAGLSVEKRAEIRRRALAEPATPEHRTWVLEDGARMVGFSCTGPTRDPGEEPARTAEVYAIYLAPDRWGRGRGRVLLSASIDDLRERGYRDVTLWVLDGNARARRFYEAAGFADDGIFKSEVFGGQDLREVRYRLRLSSSAHAAEPG